MGKNQLRPALSAFLLVLTMSLLSTALSFFVSPVWGMIYDVFDTYAPALIAMPILLTGAVISLLAAFRNVKG